jgi:hypothetical protein
MGCGCGGGGAQGNGIQYKVSPKGQAAVIVDTLPEAQAKVREAGGGTYRAVQATKPQTKASA